MAAKERPVELADLDGIRPERSYTKFHLGIC
jgi:hypothetical protein